MNIAQRPLRSFLLLAWIVLSVSILIGSGVIFQWNRNFALAFLSGQIGALCTWVVLGSASLRSRIALTVLAAIPAEYLRESVNVGHSTLSANDPWSFIVVVQLGGTAAVLVLLRLSGYWIERESGGPTAGGAFQFSVRQLLIATTFVGVFFPVVQWLLRSSSPPTTIAQYVHESVDGVALALVLLTSFWATLSSRGFFLKSLALVLMAIAIGISLYWLEESVLYHVGYTPTTYQLTSLGWRWVAWTLLTGSSFSATLTILRASGYRLVERRINRSDTQAALS